MYIYSRKQFSSKLCLFKGNWYTTIGRRDIMVIKSSSVFLNNFYARSVLATLQNVQSLDVHVSLGFQQVHATEHHFYDSICRTN